MCASGFLYSDLVDDNLSLIEKQRDLIDELSRSLATKEVVRDTVVVATKPVVKRVVVRDTVRDTVVVAAKPVVKRVVVRDTVRDTVLIPTAQTAARAELGRRGIAYTGNAFHDAARAGNLEVVRLFVMAGMSLEAYDLLRFTALHLAAANGHLEVVKFLVGAGARVHGYDRQRPDGSGLGGEGGS